MTSSQEPKTESATAADGNMRLGSLRRSLFIRFGNLVIVAVLLFVLGYLQFGVRPVIHENAASQFGEVAQAVNAVLDRTFRPAEDLVRMAASWSRDPGFDLQHPKAFNSLFRPLLESLPQITSVVAGTDDGQGWLLLQRPGGFWTNRLTDIPGRGESQHYVEWHPDGTREDRWERAAYDPRQRPWFIGALKSPGDRPVYWTEPYTFFTTHDPGITVSSLTELPDGRRLVVGFDIKLLDLSRSTGQIRIGDHGFATVLTSDQRVLGLPAAINTGSLQQIRKTVLQPAANLGIPALTAALQAWRHHHDPAGKILNFPCDGKNWLATFHFYQVGGQTFLVTALAPETDFYPAWGPMLQALAVLLAVVLLLTLFMARKQARHFSAPLEALVEDSERIACLDFDQPAPRASRYREIALLAAAQDKMRSMLRSYRDRVAAHEVELNQQINVLQTTENQLRTSEQRLQSALGHQQAILDNAMVGIVFIRDRKIAHINRRIQELFGYPGAELLSQSTECLFLNHDYFAAVSDRCEGLLNQGESFNEELWFRRNDGSRFWGQISVRAIEPADPQAGSVWIIADLTERRRAEEELQHLGHHDPLTDLPNRLLFNDRLEHAIHRAAREQQQLALLFIDLDHFKDVNDSLGHQFGDRLLCSIAARLGALLRAADTLARLGGDEFIILLEDIRDTDTVGLLAGKLLEAMAQPVLIEDHEVYITGSIGITIHPTDGQDPSSLVRNADAAMYQAKAQGRNTYYFYSEEMTLHSVRRLEMESRLRQAIAQDRLELHLQPRIDLRNGRITGAECLVRLRDAEQRLIPPEEFIQIAEETSLIYALGNWVVAETCRLWREFAGQGVRLPRIAVNISVKQLQRPNLLQVVSDALAAAALPPGILELELTESFFLETDGAFDLLRRFGGLGVNLVIDDFGTGYSSLSYLKRLPFGQLKIDRSFVREIGRDADGEALVRTIISLAKTLDLDVTAEGVETEEQRRFLVREGCVHAQGFLFAGPMPPVEFLAWVNAQVPETHPSAVRAAEPSA